MNEEEILRKKLDRLNENSHYGLMVETTQDLARIWNVGPGEIRKIVEDYIKGITGEFKPLQPYPKPPIYIKPVKVMTLRDRIIEEAAKELQNKVDKLILQKEDNEMKATSVQNIKNVKDVCFSIDSHPAEMESKLTIVASTNDDIFAFEFEGPDLLQSCKRAGMFTGWEKDQEIRELETKSKDIANDNALLLKTNKKLKNENENLKEENKNLSEANDSLYKSVYRALTEKQQTKSEYEKKLRDLNNKYKLEKAADEKPSTRADILDLAKKCVCGQREQDYGTPESNFQLIADLWNGYLGTKYRYVDDDKPINVAPLKPLDVSMMMALLKIARIRNGGGSGDSFVDLAGYAACGGEIWAEKKKQKDQN